MVFIDVKYSCYYEEISPVQMKKEEWYKTKKSYMTRVAETPSDDAPDGVSPIIDTASVARRNRRLAWWRWRLPSTDDPPAAKDVVVVGGVRVVLPVLEGPWRSDAESGDDDDAI